MNNPASMSPTITLVKPCFYLRVHWSTLPWNTLHTWSSLYANKSFWYPLPNHTIPFNLDILRNHGIDLGTAKIFSGGREGHSCLAKVRVPCLLYQGYFLMQNLQRWEISPTLPSTWQPANKLAMLIIVNGEPQHFSRIWLRILPLVGEDDPTCCQIFSWKIGHFWIRFLKWSNSVYMIIRVRAYRLFRVV